MKESYEFIFFKSFFFIKFSKNRLEIFKLKCLICHTYLLKLRVILDSFLNYIDQSSGVNKNFLSKSLKLSPR